VSVGAVVALSGGLVCLGLAIMAWYWHREAVRAIADKRRGEADLATAETAAAADHGRLEGAAVVIAVGDERYKAAIEAWFRGHPEYAADYLGICVRLATTAGADHAAVPISPAAGPGSRGSG
jgi:hypothetical protein